MASLVAHAWLSRELIRSVAEARACTDWRLSREARCSAGVFARAAVAGHADRLRMDRYKKREERYQLPGANGLESPSVFLGDKKSKESQADSYSNARSV